MNAQIVQGLADRGHDITAVAPLAPPHAWQCRYPGAPGVPTIRVPVPGLRMLPPASNIAENFAAYAQLLAQALPDIIKLTKPAAIIVGDEGAAPAIPSIAAAHHIATLAIVHGPAAAMFGADYPQQAADLVVPALHRMDAIVLVAGHLREVFQHNGFDRLRVIPNAVNTERFHPRRNRCRLRRRLGVCDDDIVVLHGSNLRPVKRAMDIIGSAALALRVEPRLLYIIAGEGPSPGELEQACLTAGVRERFRFVGWRPVAAMPLYYCNADMVSMPSAREAAALVYLETQASGRALVASDIAAARDAIEDGHTGLLHPVGNVAALARATLRLAGDEALRRALGQNGRAWVVEHRALQDCLGAYSSAIEAIVDRADLI